MNRRGSRVAAAAALLALGSALMLGPADAAAPPKKASAKDRVRLTVAVSGKGVVRILGGRLACNTACSKTFLVRKGKRLAVSAVPAVGWKVAWQGPLCGGAKLACRFQPGRPVKVVLAFVAPGARTNPIPLGVAADVGDGWSLKVASATRNANDLVLAVTRPNGDPANTPPPPGAQAFLASLAVTYNGGGEGQLRLLLLRVQALGSHGTAYRTDRDSCGVWPEPSLQYLESVFSGQTTTGNVCLRIASNDADSLLLLVEQPLTSEKPSVWFSLG
jgi:hypothetical protein